MSQTSQLSHQIDWYLDELPLLGEFVVDGGANEGALSEFFYSAGAGTNTVLSVEPVVENIAKINDRIRRAGHPDSWTLAPCALSSADGVLSLIVHRTETGQYNAVARAEATSGAPTTQITSKRLCTLAPHATVVKLDIEGHEYEVLEDSLDNCVSIKAWAIELHMVRSRKLSTTLQMFTTRGYKILAATHAPNSSGERWVSAEIPNFLEWTDIPVASQHAHGAVFKMLHIIAKK